MSKKSIQTADQLNGTNQVMRTTCAASGVLSVFHRSRKTPTTEHQLRKVVKQVIT